MSRPGCQADVVNLIEDNLHSTILVVFRKLKTMVAGRSRNLNPPHPMITLVASELENVWMKSVFLEW